MLLVIVVCFKRKLNEILVTPLNELFIIIGFSHRDVNVNIGLKQKQMG